jgi:flagellar hook-associated protein 1 FlgK
MADLLSIGLSGLRTTQNALTTTGHNIANVNTPGYSRQETIQQTNIAQFNGSGYVGSGSQTVDVRRLASDFLTSQVRSANSQNSELQTFKSQISQLDGLLSDSTTGITPAMQKFFATLQTAAQDPSSIPAREAVLAQAQGMAKSFNTLYDQVDKQNGQINDQLSALTNQVNALAKSVGSLNDAIARSKAAGGSPNDLIDSREQAIKQLSGMVGLQVVEQDDGALNLFVGTGQPLVVGNTVSSMTAKPGTDDPSRFQIVLTSGSTEQNVTSQLSGGEMGGLLSYRDTALDHAYNSLGQLSLTLADTVNKQLGQGLDLSGNAGSALFGDINDTQSIGLRVSSRPATTVSTTTAPASRRGGRVTTRRSRSTRAVPIRSP